MKLTPEQPAQYRAQGFAGPDPLLTAAWRERPCTEIGSLIDAHSVRLRELSARP